MRVAIVNHCVFCV